MEAILESKQKKQEHPFTEDYFLRGKSLGISNYENYVFLRDLTYFCADRMARFAGCEEGDTIVDFGCARGYYVKALRMLRFNAYGFDISEWAITNCHPDVKEFVSCVEPPIAKPDWIFAKDVLEHLDLKTLWTTLDWMVRSAQKGALIIVPLGSSYTRMYLAPQDNEDKTHQVCMSLDEWLDQVQQAIDALGAGHNWIAQGGYRLPGVKEACDKYPRSVGFITLRRL